MWIMGQFCLCCHKRTLRLCTSLRYRHFLLNYNTNQTSSLVFISSRLLDALHSDLYFDDVAHKETTGFQRHIPVQSEVFAVDRGFGLEGDNLLAAGILSASGELSVQHHLAGDSMDRQVSDHQSMVT